MKKLIVVLAMCLVLLFTLTACAPGFMSDSKVKSLVKKYGTPQAELTMNYTVGANKMEVKIVYDLLLDKTPIAVINFIQLVNSGFYNDSVADKYDSTYNYVIMGRYSYKNEKYLYNNSGITFAGEFKSNNYPQPQSEGGYAQFSYGALAMYHDGKAESFDKANGTFIMATKSQTFNPNNYAVFAQVASVSVSVDGQAPTTYTSIPSYVRDHIAKEMTSTITRNVYATVDATTYTSVSIMSTRVVLSIKMLGNTDWSNLPKVSA